MKKFPKNSVKNIINRACNKFKDIEIRGNWFAKFNNQRRLKLNKLYLKQNGKCDYCNRECIIGSRNGIAATVDHVVPISLGGTERFDNMVMACASCNSRRGTIEYNKFKKMSNDPVYLQKIEISLKQSRREKREIKRETKAVDNLIPRIEMILAIVYLGNYSTFWKQYPEAVIGYLEKKGKPN